jgi:hypothetical protein
MHRLAQLERSSDLVSQPLDQPSPQSRRSRASRSSGGSSGRRTRGEDSEDSNGGPRVRVQPAPTAGLFGFMADFIGGTCNIASSAMDNAAGQRRRRRAKAAEAETAGGEDAGAGTQQQPSESSPSSRKRLAALVKKAMVPSEAQLASIRRMRACSVLNPMAGGGAMNRDVGAGAGIVEPTRVPSDRERQLEGIRDGTAAAPSQAAAAEGGASVPKRKPRRILYDSETEDDTEDEEDDDDDEEMSPQDDLSLSDSDRSGSHFTGDTSEEERWLRAMERSSTATGAALSRAAAPARADSPALPPELLAAQQALARVLQTETVGPAPPVPPPPPPPVSTQADVTRLPPPPPPVRLVPRRNAGETTPTPSALPEVLGLPPLRPPPTKPASLQITSDQPQQRRGGASSRPASGVSAVPPPPSSLISNGSTKLLTQMRAPSVASTTYQVPSLNPKDRCVRF